MTAIRLAMWNCHGGLAGKADSLRSLDADVIVVPEAATPERLAARGFVWDGPMQWMGDNRDKGLLVLARPQWTLKVHETLFASQHWMLPLVVGGDGVRLHLLAVWSMTHRSQGTPALVASGGAVTGIERYRDFLDADDAVVMGDLNNSIVWDGRGTGPRTMHALLAALGEQGFESAYHALRGEEMGRETEKTYHHTYNVDLGHHIDYCFTRLGRATRCDVGSYAAWTETRLSDHAAVTVDVQLAGEQF